MRDAIYEAGRPIVFSICEWGENEPWKWAKDVGHLWRTTIDIVNCFDCKTNWGGLGVLQIIDAQVPLRIYSGPGHWNDMDMLEIGNDKLTSAEAKTHFSMWSMLASPLIAGNDLRKMDPETIDILTNKEVIAINQDTLGASAIKMMDYGDFEIWFKPLENKNYAVCFMNRSDQPYKMDYTLNDKGVFDNAREENVFYKITDNYQMYDIWNKEDLGRVTNKLDQTIDPHGVLLLKLTKK